MPWLKTMTENDDVFISNTLKTRKLISNNLFFVRISNVDKMMDNV